MNRKKEKTSLSVDAFYCFLLLLYGLCIFLLRMIEIDRFNNAIEKEQQAKV